MASLLANQGIKMGQTNSTPKHAVNLQSTSAWDSAEQIVRLAAELLPHINRAIDAENSSLNYAAYIALLSEDGYVSREREGAFFEQTGQYFAENVNKLQKLRELLMWLAENTI